MSPGLLIDILQHDIWQRLESSWSRFRFEKHKSKIVLI